MSIASVIPVVRAIAEAMKSKLRAAHFSLSINKELPTNIKIMHELFEAYPIAPEQSASVGAGGCGRARSSHAAATRA